MPQLPQSNLLIDKRWEASDLHPSRRRRLEFARARKQTVTVVGASARLFESAAAPRNCNQKRAWKPSLLCAPPPAGGRALFTRPRLHVSPSTENVGSRPQTL